MSRLTRGHIIALPVRGYHPLRPCFPDRFRLSLMCHWPDPLSLATTSGVSVDVLSSRYLDVSVPWVCLKPLILFGGLIPSLDNRKSKTSSRSRSRSCLVSPKPLSSHRRKVLEFRLSKVGFPIRKSADQSFFAAPHGLSQRSTSFIASQRQGIHRTPLRHLIALIINVHTLGRMHAAPSRREYRGRTLTRKTSLLRKIEPMARRSGFANRIIHNPHPSCDGRAPK